MTAPLIIIGTGLAGYNLAKEFRKLDADRQIILVSQDDGRQYSKPLLSTGFSKGKDANGLAMNDAGAMADALNAQIRTHQTVTQINPEDRTVTLGEEVISYGDLVLAVGAEPIQLPIDGSEFAHHVNDLEDYDRFYTQVQGRRSVTVIGAGLVGTEYAHDLAGAGFQVNLIAPEAQPLARLIPDVCGQALIPALQNLGVTLHLERGAKQILKNGEGYSVLLDDGSVVDSDIVLSAVGLAPRKAIAAAAGLKVGRAIEVDRLLKTSADHVYALGDCAAVEGLNLLYVLPLMASARALAKTLAGQPTPVSYGVMPVQVKTPSLPIVTCPPAADAAGQWVVTGVAPDLVARFEDSDGNLIGYALTGAGVAEKMALNKELPAMLA